MSDLSRWAAEQQTRNSKMRWPQGLRAVRAGRTGCLGDPDGALCSVRVFPRSRAGAWQAGDWRVRRGGAGNGMAVVGTGSRVLIGTSRRRDCSGGDRSRPVGLEPDTKWTETADKVLAPASFIAIALMGAWAGDARARAGAGPLWRIPLMNMENVEAAVMPTAPSVDSGRGRGPRGGTPRPSSPLSRSDPARGRCFC